MLRRLVCNVIASPGSVHQRRRRTPVAFRAGWSRSGATARTDAPDYEAAAKQWLSEIDPIIAAHQITRGGDVILYQVENELFYKEPATINYMADLIAKVKADGINVPLTGNHSGTYNGTPGAVAIDGYDSYPQGFNCANPSTFSSPGSFSPFAGEPLMLPEFQGGSYDSWGGSGYDNCYEMTNSDFENVFYKSNFADGVTIQSNYMTVGGTNWGWLPAPFMYTSYDYGLGDSRRPARSALRPTRTTSPAPNTGEQAKLGDFLQSVPSLTKTQGVAAPTSSNPAVTVQARGNPDDSTQFLYLRQRNASSTSDVSTHLALNTEPSFGYTYDDTDPALNYTGNWSHVTNQSFTGGDYKDTESYSDTTGDSMSVTFTGTAVQYIRADGQQPRVRGHLPGRHQGRDRGRLFVGHRLPAGALFGQQDWPTRPHAQDRRSYGSEGRRIGRSTFVSVDAINVPTAAQQSDYYSSVPQQPRTSICGAKGARRPPLSADQLRVRRPAAPVLDLELMTHAELGDSALALLYGPAGTDGETVLRYSSQPTVNVVQGGVQSTWDASQRRSAAELHARRPGRGPGQRRWTSWARTADR